MILFICSLLFFVSTRICDPCWYACIFNVTRFSCYVRIFKLGVIEKIYCVKEIYYEVRMSLESKIWTNKLDSQATLLKIYLLTFQFIYKFTQCLQVVSVSFIALFALFVICNLTKADLALRQENPSLCERCIIFYRNYLFV